MSCNCCITPDQISALVKAALYGEITAGNLQAPLLGCDGVKLGAAKVPTCDEMTLAIDTAIQRIQPVIHDSTLSGYGSCQSPLTVNTSWLQAFILNLADTIPLVHTGGADGGLDGDGTEANPLTLDVQHDNSLTGKGTKASPLELNANHDGSMDGTGKDGDPLKVDETWLTEQIKTYVDNNGIHTADGSGLAGDGSASEPLKLDINHDESIDGDGTAANPLKVDKTWLDNEIKQDMADGDILVPDASFRAVDEAQTDGVSTTIIGGQDATLGRPEAYVKLGDYVIPAYKGVAA